MTIDCTAVPKWLKVMRAISGVTEEPGETDNPKIMGMRDWIACSYDDMMNYCEGYVHDDTPWCFDGSVEVLTERGFVRFDALRNERVYQADQDSRLSLTNAIKIIKDYDGDVFDIDHDQIKLTCDVGHRWYGYWGRPDKLSFGTLDRLIAPAVIGRPRKGAVAANYALNIPAICSGSNGLSLSDDQLRLLAAFIADGKYRASSGRLKREQGIPWSIDFEVSKQRKIAALLALCPAHVYTQAKAYGPLTKTPLTVFRFLFPTWFSEVFSDYKTLSRAFINGLSKDQARIFLESYAQFDGNGKTVLYTSDKQRCDDLATIILMAGHHPNVYERKDGSNLTKKQPWRVSWSPHKQTRTLTQKNISRRHFTGKLYCVSVSEQRIVVRGQNRNPILTGNCGLTAAFAMTVAGIKPPFGPTDTDRWLWALAWADDPHFQKLTKPVLGCVAVMEREGGGHVTFYESTSGSNYKCRGGNQSDAINVQSYAIDTVVALVWPIGVPLPSPAPGPGPGPGHETIEEGDTGPDVEEVQRILGIPVDGDFGGQTDAAVKGFQAAMDLDVDGAVGPATWEELDKLDAKMMAGTNGLDNALADKIIDLAVKSDIADYEWEDRGRSPPGLIPGMALCFALAMQKIKSSPVKVMAQADRDEPDTDALSWYAEEFRALRMSTDEDGIDTLRALFVLAIGLSMRESSGDHWCGRDQSADNTSPDTAEAGAWQTSWDVHSASSEITKLFNRYWDDPNGFAETFSEGLSPSESDLGNYGQGAQGTQYQWLAKYSPAFAVMMTAVGLRTRRQHWGPIGRKEVELKESADRLLQDVQELVAASA